MAASKKATAKAPNKPATKTAPAAKETTAAKAPTAKAALAKTAKAPAETTGGVPIEVAPVSPQTVTTTGTTRRAADTGNLGPSEIGGDLTGKVNANGELMGGLTPESAPAARPKASKVPDGFEAVGGNDAVLRATRDHTGKHVPPNTQRESTSLLFPAGQTFPRSQVDAAVEAGTL